MFNNLKAEYTRKGVIPYKGIMGVLGCVEKTARNKLNGKTQFTVPEAICIKEKDFPNLSIEYLFATNDNQTA